MSDDVNRMPTAADMPARVWLLWSTRGYWIRPQPGGDIATDSLVGFDGRIKAEAAAAQLGGIRGEEIVAVEWPA